VVGSAAGHGGSRQIPRAKAQGYYRLRQKKTVNGSGRLRFICGEEEGMNPEADTV